MPVSEGEIVVTFGVTENTLPVRAAARNEGRDEEEKAVVSSVFVSCSPRDEAFLGTGLP